MKIKFSLYSMYTFLLLIPLFQPKLFTQYPDAVLLYAVLNILEFGLLIYFYIKSKRKMPKVFLAWVGYRYFILFMMIANKNISDLDQWGYLSLMVSNLLLLFDRTKNKGKVVLNISLLTNLLLFLNVITLLVFERGIIKSTFWDVTAGDYYLLGIKTQFTTMIIPAICSSVICLYLYKKKWPLIISCTLSIFTIFYSNISTAKVGLLLVILFVIMTNILKIKFNYVSLVLFSVLLQISIVFFKVQGIFSNFVENVLGKDISFSSRTYIWINAKRLIGEQNIFNLLFGNGIVKGGNFVPYQGTYWQPHNQMLFQIYMTGILGTLFFYGAICQLNKKNKIRNNLNQFLIYFCFIVLFMTTVEVYFEIATCYVPFILLFYSDELQKGDLSSE